MFHFTLTIPWHYSFGTHIVRAGAEHIGSIVGFRLFRRFHGVRRSRMLSALQGCRSTVSLLFLLSACDGKTRLSSPRVIKNLLPACVPAGSSALAVCRR